MKLGLSTLLFIGESLEKEHAMMLKAHGVESVELWGMPPHVSYRDPDSWKRVAALFDGEGVAVNSVHGPFYETLDDADRARWLSISDVKKKNRAKALDAVKRTIDLMELVRSRLLVLHFGMLGDPTRQEALEAIISSLVNLQEYISRSEIKIAFENLGTPFSTSGFIVNVLSRYDFHNMGVNLDFGHANLNEEPVSAVANCGARLFGVHVSDNAGVNDSHLLPGEGCIDWKAICVALLDVGYKGDFTFEPHGANDSEETLKKIRASYETLVKPILK